MPINLNLIEKNTLLDKIQQKVVTESLKGKISIYAVPAKNDYVNDFDRGTVKYRDDNWNYSFHKVIIPDKTVVEERNFTQKEPHTVAITGKDLRFVNCNLVNVELDPSWTLEDCNTSQIKLVVVKQEPAKNVKGADIPNLVALTISHQVEKSGHFVDIGARVIKIPTGDLANRLQRFNEVA